MPAAPSGTQWINRETEPPPQYEDERLDDFDLALVLQGMVTALAAKVVPPDSAQSQNILYNS
jgi:hypothetical protein